MKKHKIITATIGVIAFFLIKCFIENLDMVQKFDFLNNLIGEDEKYLDRVENIISGILAVIVSGLTSLIKFIELRLDTKKLKQQKPFFRIDIRSYTTARKSINDDYQPVIELIENDRNQFIYIKCDIKNIGGGAITNFKVRRQCFLLSPHLYTGNTTRYYFRVSVPFKMKCFFLKYEDEKGKQFRQFYYMTMKKKKINFKKWRFMG